MLDESSKRTLLNNEIYIPSAYDFNDPFDCKINYEFDSSEEFFRKELRKHIREEHPKISEIRLNSIVESKMEKGVSKHPIQSRQIANSSRSYWLNRIGIYCLSEINDNILMWSHYSNGHRGFCLEFNINMSSKLSEAKQVKYQNKYPNKLRYTGDKNDKAFFNTILLTKSDSWDYEKEWRIIATNGPGVYKINDGDLNGIIFGCQISDEDRSKIISLARKRSDNLKLFQAKIKQKEFGLDIIPFG